MTYEGVPVAELSPAVQQSPAGEVAVEVFDGTAFLAQHGLEGIANDVIEAHGSSFTVAAAIEGCGPLADMISSLSRDLANVPGHSRIIKNAIVSAGVSTAEKAIPEESKKKMS